MNAGTESADTTDGSNPSPGASDAKQRVRSVVDDWHDRLVGISHDLWDHPELAYAEHHASALLCDTLEQAGIAVERGAFGLETAFVARVGDATGPNIVICCEYDALPVVGHACGHNVIATMGVGAGIAAASVALELGGTVTILGTPAEEGGGGKIKLLAAGAFDGADAAIMVHPEMGEVEYVPFLAADSVDVVMIGREAHASSSPWDGTNALDALVSGYVALQMMRSTLHSDEKLHVIITEGGVADNIIPARAVARCRVRAGTASRLAELMVRVEEIWHGAAIQVGCEVEMSWRGSYLDMINNRALAAAYRANGEALGRSFYPPEIVPREVAGSTDMGNVSHVVPAAHPVIEICPIGVACHTPEFAQWARSEKADNAIAAGAATMAMTAVDLWTRPELVAAIRAEFNAADRAEFAVAASPDFRVEPPSI